jgi:ketosteroid isomerase-like protein
MPDDSTTPDLVELGRRIQGAVNRREFDLLNSVYAPDAVVEAEGLGTFGGRAAIRRFFEDMVGSFDQYVIEQEEFLDLGNGVGFEVARQSGRLLGSAGRIQQRFASVTESAEGLIMRGTFYTDIDEARATAERLAQERADG